MSISLIDIQSEEADEFEVKDPPVQLAGKEICGNCQTMFGNLDTNYGDDTQLWRQLKRRYHRRVVHEVIYNGMRLCQLCYSERIDEKKKWERALAPKPFLSVKANA